MRLFSKIETLYREAKANKWLHYFAVLCRVSLALGFIPSGFLKITGERFTALPSNHPLGQYFDALHLTGYYYTFLGIVQATTAVLLLIPRTALLGAIMYFPIILNICVLAYATRFEGTRITTLMLLADLFLLCWDYERLKSILPFGLSSGKVKVRNRLSSKFPVRFFASVVTVIATVIIINQHLYDIRPGNSLLECKNGCAGNPRACNFCDCIYNEGKPLDTCLAEFRKAENKNATYEKKVDN